MRDKILNWLTSGETGISSKVMVQAALNQELTCTDHPLDPDDFRRCLKLVYAVPEIKERFEDIAQISLVWLNIINNWGELEILFLDEVGINCEKGYRATKTYELMKALGC